MRPLSESTARVASRHFERKYIALGRIVKHWPEIVGASLADKTQPVKIHYRKAEKKGAKALTSLDIAARSADATMLHYQKDLILERINQIFGERWISAIRFVSTPANTEPLLRKKRPAPLTPVEKNTLSGMLHSVQDESMHLSLQKLGAAIIAKEKT
ncbi:MAG: DciA family protein [Alphaproteobacteria bacterium]